MVVLFHVRDNDSSTIGSRHAHRTGEVDDGGRQVAGVYVAITVGVALAKGLPSTTCAGEVDDAAC